MAAIKFARIAALLTLGFIINAAIFLAAAAGPTVIASLAIIGAFFLVLTLYRPTATTVFEIDTPFVVGMFVGFLWARNAIGF